MGSTFYINKDGNINLAIVLQVVTSSGDILSGVLSTKLFPGSAQHQPQRICLFGESVRGHPLHPEHPPGPGTAQVRSQRKGKRKGIYSGE